VGVERDLQWWGGARGGGDESVCRVRVCGCVGLGRDVLVSEGVRVCTCVWGGVCVCRGMCVCACAVCAVCAVR
jgi:hypothetical protein